MVPLATNLDPDHLSVALCKGSRFTRNPHPLCNFLCFDHLPPPYSAFVLSLFSVFVPKTTSEALLHASWCQAMFDDIEALHSICNDPFIYELM